MSTISMSIPIIACSINHKKNKWKIPRKQSFNDYKLTSAITISIVAIVATSVMVSSSISVEVSTAVLVETTSSSATVIVVVPAQTKIVSNRDRRNNARKTESNYRLRRSSRRSPRSRLSSRRSHCLALSLRGRRSPSRCFSIASASFRRCSYISSMALRNRE